jgi:hypothetical protein
MSAQKRNTRLAFNKRPPPPRRVEARKREDGSGMKTWKETIARMQKRIAGTNPHTPLIPAKAGTQESKDRSIGLVRNGEPLLRHLDPRFRGEEREEMPDPRQLLANQANLL